MADLDRLSKAQEVWRVVILASDTDTSVVLYDFLFLSFPSTKLVYFISFVGGGDKPFPSEPTNFPISNLESQEELEKSLGLSKG